MNEVIYRHIGFKLILTQANFWSDGVNIIFVFKVAHNVENLIYAWFAVHSYLSIVFCVWCAPEP